MLRCGAEAPLIESPLELVMQYHARLVQSLLLAFARQPTNTPVVIHLFPKLMWQGLYTGGEAMCRNLVE